MRGNALLTASLLLCGSSAAAASFHCGKASSAVGETICANPALSKADDAEALHRAWQRRIDELTLVAQKWQATSDDHR